MTKITKQALKKITLEYGKALEDYKQLVEQEEITSVSVILAAYDKVNESHKKYMEVTRQYVIEKSRPQS